MLSQFNWNFICLLEPSLAILHDTFIEVFVEEVNKLKDINVSKIVIDDTFDDISESDEDIIED